MYVCHTVQVLIEYGGDVHVQTSEGYAPLHVASMWGRVEAVRELLDHGADPLVYDEEEMLPLDLAREGGKLGLAGEGDKTYLWPITTTNFTLQVTWSVLNFLSCGPPSTLPPPPTPAMTRQWRRPLSPCTWTQLMT